MESFKLLVWHRLHSLLRQLAVKDKFHGEMASHLQTGLDVEGAFLGTRASFTITILSGIGP